MNRRHIVGAMIGTVAASTLASPVSGHAPTDGRGATGAPARGRSGARLPNVALHTHEGRSVRFYDDLIKDKTVLLNFMYTACKDECPLTMATLARLQQGLGARSGRAVFIYSITVDPKHDTPEVLRRYAERFGAKPGWLFLTGTTAEIMRLRRGLGDDPSLEPAQSDHLNLLTMGIEPLARWTGCPTWTKPETILRYLAWMEPNGERPADTLQGA
jgi:protein SCO1/2